MDRATKLTVMAHRAVQIAQLTRIMRDLCIEAFDGPVSDHIQEAADEAIDWTVELGDRITRAMEKEPGFVLGKGRKLYGIDGDSVREDMRRVTGSMDLEMVIDIWCQKFKRDRGLFE
jgi:hypothetical protein